MVVTRLLEAKFLYAQVGGIIGHFVLIFACCFVIHNIFAPHAL